MVKFYKDEGREDMIRKLVDEAIGEPGKWRCPIDWAASRITPDRCWWHDEFLILIGELKNTLGLSGDALYQAIVDYSKIVSRDKV